ncbi:restriction endonuclease subunit S [Desulfoscipio geothermicus]|uniref:Type I restriction modification DNA specificity domain-containing protein n=1 Tax=Desulfoscipio geothermicus DSM 3669 TaxID=1121426 RepID=A0A1I6DIT9_9FIRM|nr:restriction endonuclease subunit S [Desulfoscipio geothermicus]SFR05262.1 Type I restriction modification DNA specificity domain-containing protein [Desulfoscipio geothermicus DSM 3669]
MVYANAITLLQHKKLSDVMKTKLKEIASIQMGYSFRTRLESIGTGTIAVIQMKDLTVQNRVDCSGLIRINIEKLKDQHLAKPGDIIFRSRGQATTSAILLDDPGKAVVAAPLIRIRVTEDSVLPEYLNWFINQIPAQTFLASYAAGTAQKMISKQALENLEVFIPSLARQRTIIKLASLAEEEQSLITKIADKRRQYIALALIKLAKGE